MHELVMRQIVCTSIRLRPFLVALTVCVTRCWKGQQQGGVAIIGIPAAGRKDVRASLTIKAVRADSDRPSSGGGPKPEHIHERRECDCCDMRKTRHRPRARPAREGTLYMSSAS